MSEEKRLNKINSVLTQGENIEKSFNLNGCRAYATNKRLFRLEGNNIRDFDYNHISSTGYSPKHHWILIILGVLFATAGYYVGDVNDEPAITIGGVVIGMILVLTWIFWKEEIVVTDVIGVEKKIEYRGHRQELDSLLKIIREKKNDAQSYDNKVSNNQDFAENLRKLAELKDEGIVDQREFEEKKGQILRDPGI
jgi:hypothetical protein